MRLSFYGMLWLSLLVAWPHARAQEVPESEPVPPVAGTGVIDMEAVVGAGVQPGGRTCKERHRAGAASVKPGIIRALR